MTHPHHHHGDRREKTFSLADAMVAISTGADDASGAVLDFSDPAHPRPAIALVMQGIPYRHAVAGILNVSAEAISLHNLDTAGQLIAEIAEAFERLGVGPALWARVDRERTEIREQMSKLQGDKP